MFRAYRCAQIQLQQILYIQKILDDNRLVETILRLISGHDFRIAERSLAQIGGHRISRDQFGQYKNQRCNAEQHDNQIYQSLSYKFQPFHTTPLSKSFIISIVRDVSTFKE